MSIDLDLFAQECVEQGLYLGVAPHYLMAVAQLRSGISDAADAADPSLIGPFRLTQVNWNAYCTDTEFDFNFLPTDISDPLMQCAVFGLMVHRAFDAFVSKNSRNPTATELYVQQWPDSASATLAADLQTALDATKDHIVAAAATVLDTPNPPPLTIPNSNGQPAPPPSGPFNLSSIAAARQPMAQKILSAFAAAGFGIYQQAAALANAIAESNLDPNAHAAVGEDSWGIFQLNRKGGLGQGHNPADLVNPDTNIAIVVDFVRKYPEFAAAGTLDRAVSAFVRDVEKPSDPTGQIINRLKIAQQLLPAGSVVAVVSGQQDAAAQNAAAGNGARPAIVQVAAGSTINGFDCAHYPGDDIMDWLRNNGGFRVTGLYLTHWPNKPDNSWISKRSYLAGRGWGFFPTYVGLQIESSNLNSQTGATHALEAAQLMQSAGFAASSVVYLDMESGDTPSGGYADYIQGWLTTVKNSQFNPGLYCSHLLTTWALQRTPLVWSFQVPNGTKGQTYDPAQLPTASINGKCVATQYLQDIKLQGLTVPPSVDDGLDLDICAIPDPSHLATIAHSLGVVS
jgi:hypothetical protein